MEILGRTSRPHGAHISSPSVKWGNPSSTLAIYCQKLVWYLAQGYSNRARDATQGLLHV